MKEYWFSYTDQLTLTRLLVFCFGIFLLLIFTITSISNFIGLTGAILVTFIIPSLVFWFNRKAIKKDGTATVTIDYVELALAKGPVRIEFININSILVSVYNGSSLTVQLKDKSRFFIRANVNFTEPHTLAHVCEAVYQQADRFAITNSITVIKKKTGFTQSLTFSK